jgi:hypothetical protein
VITKKRTEIGSFLFYVVVVFSEPEGDGEDAPHIDLDIVDGSRLPTGHLLDDTHSLLVERAIA